MVSGGALRALALAASLGSACGGRATRSGEGDASGSGGAAGSGASGGDGATSAAGTTAGTANGGSANGGSAGSDQPSRVDKLDLLLMIDNSPEMTEKQRLLAEALPGFLERLARPLCVDEHGVETGARAASDGSCASGTAELTPLVDLHIGIVTSSLGSHGGDQCSPDPITHFDDRAQLLGSVRAGVPGTDAGFVRWDPSASLETLLADTEQQLQAVGETGCHFESGLEAWYRFLIDPEPVSSMGTDSVTSVRGPVNQVVLAQRAAFLRPDSLLAIVMLSDENDCSILDEAGTQGFLVGFQGGTMMSSGNFRMPAATASCQNPNDPCCRPCVSPAAVGCPNDTAEGCPPGGYLTLTSDPVPLRCARQRERFGIDLLYPVERYLEALESPLIDPRLTGAPVENPLFPSQGPRRRPDMVYLAGIVGVPWQDAATSESLSAPRKLVFASPAELEAEGRWAVMLGEPSSGVPPADPFMLERVEPRAAGSPHPLDPSIVVQAPGSRTLNAVNGREQAVAAADDLQPACIFPLRTPIPCDDDDAYPPPCSCRSNEAARDSPACSYPEPNAHGTQIASKAYPGLRYLEVLRGAGEQGVVASVCPKNVSPDGESATDPDYGYTPALTALFERLKPHLTAARAP